ncbi:unnamed protein product [Arabidopsis halleri]
MSLISHSFDHLCPHDTLPVYLFLEIVPSFSENLHFHNGNCYRSLISGNPPFYRTFFFDEHNDTETYI